MSIKDFIRLTKLEDCRISPDGSYVLFETRDPDFEHDDYNHTLWLADPRSEKARRLTHSGKDTSASWAPNSKRVAFISERDGSKELYVIDVDGGEAEKITHAGAVGPLSWSTDGRRIAYSHTVPVAEKPADVPEASWQRRPYVISDRTYKIDGTGISVRAHPQIMV